MNDAHIDPQIDLSPETLGRACKGDIRKLPSFVVHDDEAWPWFNKVRPGKGKIHLRRSTFNRVIVPQVPVKPGLWLRADAQEYFIDLKPHHLGGSEDQTQYDPNAKNHETARIAAKADEAGRLPDEADYGERIMERSDSGAVDRDDLERVASDPEKRGVGSTVLSGGDTESDLAMGDDD